MDTQEYYHLINVMRWHIWLQSELGSRWDCIVNFVTRYHTCYEEKNEIWCFLKTILVIAPNTSLNCGSQKNLLSFSRA